MNREFKYLIDKYGESGARERFEKICLHLIQKNQKNALPVKCNPGDDGIDIYVRQDENINIYQCKYFINSIGDSQKEQIRKSFKQLMKSQHKNRVTKWILCIPISMTSKEHDWWIRWSNDKEKEYSIGIDIMDESKILNELRDTGLYEYYFDIIKVDKKMLGKANETDYYIEDILPIINIVSENEFRIFNPLYFINECEEVVRKYKFHPFFSESKLIIAIDCLTEQILGNVKNNRIDNKNTLDEIFELRKIIIKEYHLLFY